MVEPAVFTSSFLLTPSIAIVIVLTWLCGGGGGRWWRGVSRGHYKLYHFMDPIGTLPGVFNPILKNISQNMSQIGSFPQGSGWKKKQIYFKPPPTWTFKGVPIKP